MSSMIQNKKIIQACAVTLNKIMLEGVEWGIFRGSENFNIALTSNNI
jgi:hypothetical protein